MITYEVVMDDDRQIGPYVSLETARRSALAALTTESPSAFVCSIIPHGDGLAGRELRDAYLLMADGHIEHLSPDTA